MLNGFSVKRLPNVEGVLVASFSSVPDGEIYGRFEGCFVPNNDYSGRGFLLTPSNGSRDLIEPYFTQKDGVEYCYAASFLYRDEATLENYCDQDFSSFPQGEYNRVYRICRKLEQLPQVPQGRRLVVLNKEMEVVYDSQNPKEKGYQPVEEGYISFI